VLVTSRAKTRRTLRLIGLFLIAAPGLPVAGRLLYAVPASTVESCQTSYSHRPYAHVRLASGTRLSLSPDDVPEPARCLAFGAGVEKRRWELAYRLDGMRVLPSSPSWKAFPVLVGAGLLLLAGSVLVRGDDG
jgi:hypothetical protein